MGHRKQPERRTFLQDRFDILIKRQKTGKATFNELTELDDIVNRDLELREKVIRENILMEGIDDNNEPENLLRTTENVPLQNPVPRSLLNRIKAFFTRLFTFKTAVIKNRVISFHLHQFKLV